MIFRRLTEEQRQEKRAEQDAQWRAAEAARKADEFRKSPVGRARTGFERGDQIFQITLRASDPNETLNSILAEGWLLHSFGVSDAIRSDANANGVYSVTSDRACIYIFVRRALP